MESDLPARCSIDPDDGPIARRDTPQWTAWANYYRDARLWFHFKTMQQYKWRQLDWPVPFDMPPTTVNPKNRMPWPWGNSQ